MTNKTIPLNNAIDSIEKSLHQANNYFMNSLYRHEANNNDDSIVAEYYIERAFIELLVLTEHLSLNAIFKQIELLFQEAKKDFLKSKMGPDEPYLVWSEKIRMYVDGIANAHGLGETSESEMKDIKDIIKRALYVICDKNLFPSLPEKEAHVHDRIEAILKCHFADLKRKPPLSKPIKNFEPDSGIPSSKTLIEYKFVNTKSEAKIVVDQILADTCGYRTPQWKNLLFVIYETHRVMPEEEWSSLLKECELGNNYDIMVLSGDPK
ncbi:MAG: hypothetical protein CTY16_13805 [Methylobacter sp.]|nr:MAG: hypothetical protein CTY16_13805 [Methylobacter sp.]